MVSIGEQGGYNNNHLHSFAYKSGGLDNQQVGNSWLANGQG